MKLANAPLGLLINFNTIPLKSGIQRYRTYSLSGLRGLRGAKLSSYFARGLLRITICCVKLLKAFAAVISLKNAIPRQFCQLT